MSLCHMGFGINRLLGAFMFSSRHMEAIPKYDTSLTKIMADVNPYFDPMHAFSSLD